MLFQKCGTLLRSNVDDSNRYHECHLIYPENLIPLESIHRIIAWKCGAQMCGGMDFYLSKFWEYVMKSRRGAWWNCFDHHQVNSTVEFHIFGTTKQTRLRIMGLRIMDSMITHMVQWLSLEINRTFQDMFGCKFLGESLPENLHFLKLLLLVQQISGDLMRPKFLEAQICGSNLHSLLWPKNLQKNRFLQYF